MRISILFLIVLSSFSVSLAQQVYIQPPLVNIPGCTSIAELYAVNINNFQNEVVRCAMQIEISYTGSSLRQGVVANGQLSGAPIFNLPVGITQITTSNVGRYFPVRNLQFLDPTLQNINDQSACLPPGEYDVCIALYGLTANGVIDLNKQISRTCFKRIKQNTNNIFLISPNDNSKVQTLLPIFTWTPIANFDSKSNYVFEIVELLNGQTPFDAFKSNPIFYSENALKTNTLQYPIKARSLNTCKKYAWRVGYYSDGNFNIPSFNAPLKASVYSELWNFEYQCGNPNIINKRSLKASSLVSPNNQEKLSNENQKIIFSWTELTPPQDYNITYLLRVVEKPENETKQFAFNNGTPTLSQPILNNSFYNFPIASGAIDKKKEYVWGVIPYNGAQEQIIENSKLAVFQFGFESIPNIKSKECPLNLGKPVIAYNNYNPTKNNWTLRIDLPNSNAIALENSLEEIEINGVKTYMGPIISKLTTNTSDQEFTIDIAKQGKNYVELIVSESKNQFEKKEKKRY